MKNWMLNVAALALVWSIPAVAAAQECTSDADCDEGYMCVPSACPACAPGEECPECPEGGMCEPLFSEGPSIVTTFECETDADCPDYFACQQVEQWDCPAGEAPGTCACPDCDPDADPECPPCDCGEFEESEPVDCEPQLAMACVLEIAECETDADCETGWSCEVQEACWGSGCACACECPPCEAGQECPECTCEEECDCGDVEEECEVVGAWCAPNEVECSADADCPEGWTCESIPSAVASTCACAGCACEEGDDSCECPPCDCGEETETTPAESQSICLPGGWSDLMEDGAIASVDGAAGGSGGGQGSGAPEAEAGGFFDNLLDGGSGGAAGGAGNGDDKATGGGEEGTSDPTTPTAGDDAGSGGCNANGGAGSSGGLMALAALALAVMRRRSRSAA